VETNILGLPSLTGFTPLKATREGQILKYDFREAGPIVLDKSGHGNNGRAKPIGDPPRREIYSLVPLKVVMNFDGENDYVNIGRVPIKGEFSVSIRVSIDNIGRSGRVFGGRYQEYALSWDADRQLFIARRDPIGLWDRCWGGEVEEGEFNRVVMVGRILERNRKQLDLFVNGSKVHSVTAKGDWADEPLGLGARYDGGHFLDCRVSKFCIYNRALTEDEV